MTTPNTTLRAFSRDKETPGVKESTTYRVDPNLIHFEKGFNLRDETPELEEHRERLYLAMKAGAFIPPVDVQVIDGKIFARDGHSRTYAAKRMRKEVGKDYTIEVRELRGSTDTDAVLHMLGTGSGGKPLTPLEQGRGFIRLIRYGMQPAQIAEKLGITRVTVDNCLQIAEAPADVQAMIIDGSVSATEARKVVKKGAKAVKALKEAVAAKKAAPAKKGKKKKTVTAKDLKGTAAGKKSKKVKAMKPATESGWHIIEPDEIRVTVKKDAAQRTVEYLREFANPEDSFLMEMASALEVALLS